MGDPQPRPQAYFCLNGYARLREEAGEVVFTAYFIWRERKLRGKKLRWCL